MNPFVYFALIGVNIILIILILLQQKGTALGASFGQEGGFYGTLRGVEKKLFWATCIFGAAFIILVVLSHVLNG